MSKRRILRRNRHIVGANTVRPYIGFPLGFSVVFVRLFLKRWHTNLDSYGYKTKARNPGKIPKLRAVSLVEVTRFELAAPTSRT